MEKTTITIKGVLKKTLREARLRAIQEDRTISSVVREALKEYAKYTSRSEVEKEEKQENRGESR